MYEIRFYCSKGGIQMNPKVSEAKFRTNIIECLPFRKEKNVRDYSKRREV